MKKILMAAVAVLAGIAQPVLAQEKLSITPTLVAAAEKEGQVTLQYSSPLEAMQALMADFNKVYPKIHVNLERKAGTTGAQSLLQELAAGVHRIDVFAGTDAGANTTLVAQHAFVPVVPENVKDMGASATVLAPSIYYSDVSRYVVMYNPKFVSEAEAAKLVDWKGILDPAFKGRISLVEPAFGVVLAPLLYVMNAPGLGEPYLKQLKAQNPAIYLNTAQARDALISGQQPIAFLAQWEAVALGTIESGAPVRFVYSNPMVESLGNGWGIVAEPPHPNAARLLLAWLLSRDGGLAMQGPIYAMRSSLTNLEDTRAGIARVAKESWYHPPGEVWHPDLKDWFENSPKYQETFDKIMHE